MKPIHYELLKLDTPYNRQVFSMVTGIKNLMSVYITHIKHAFIKISPADYFNVINKKRTDFRKQMC